MRIFIILIFLLPFMGLAQTTEFDAEKQYNQAMANAKLAFEANQYSEAVMFYREAMKIKHDALLPRYKVEDIRTIYIEEELKKEPTAIADQPKRKSKKQMEAEKQLAQKKAEKEATRKMNEDADRAASELRNLNIDVVEIQESENDFLVNNAIEIQDAEKDNKANLQIKATDINESDEDFDLDNNIKVDQVVADEQANLKISATEVDESDEDLEINDSEKVMELEDANELQLSIRVININEETEEIVVVDEIEVVEFAEIPKVERKVKPKSVIVEQPKPTERKQMTAEEKKVWVEKENKRLAVKYPNRKTVEEIDKPGKHITRVIMNIDNKVNIYLKVKHSWGATFYFIDEIGQELRSINQQYFNLMTNLDTYGP